MTKSEQLQLRVTPEQKQRIKHLAALAGEDVSTWILQKIVPAEAETFRQLISALRDHPTDPSFPLAAIHDFLASTPASALEPAVQTCDLRGLDAFQANYLAAMVELACATRQVTPPDWPRTVPPLDRPWFASTLKGLRLHLLTRSPAPFRRRNLFIDSSVGDRV
ncbi:MAG: hypothetical protein R3E84_03400 [Pseudomonadales bacterium]